MKMFPLCLNQDELAVLTLYIPTFNLLVQSVVYSYWKVVK